MHAPLHDQAVAMVGLIIIQAKTVAGIGCTCCRAGMEELVCMADDAVKLLDHPKFCHYVWLVSKAIVQREMVALDAINHTYTGVTKQRALEALQARTMDELNRAARHPKIQTALAAAVNM